MLEILSKHLALLSGAAVLLASMIVMVFIYAYLSVFDKALVWMIEYTDIAKFGLLAVVLISAFFTHFIYVIENSYRLMVQKSALIQYIIIVILLSIISVPCYGIYDAFINNTCLMEYHIYLLSSYILVLAVIFDSIKIPHTKIDFLDVSRRITLLIFILTSVGRTTGLHVRDVMSYQHNISINGNELSNAKIIMILSHHSIFYVGKDIIVAQTAQVNKIITKSPID
jgi:hypothetical protein